MVKEGRYLGFGYIDTSAQVSTLEDFEPFIKLQQATYHTNKILSNYMRKQGAPNILFFDPLPQEGRVVSSNFSEELFSMTG